MTPAEAQICCDRGLQNSRELNAHWSSIATPVKIVVIDDNPSFCELLHQQLTLLLNWPCSVETFFSGNSAIEYLKVFTPDILFCDLRMPKDSGTGLDVLRAIDRTEMVVLIVTGLMDDAPEIAEAKAMGIKCFIRKTSLLRDLQTVFPIFGKGISK
jgi:CheY-like chemotaxis protein